RSAVTKQAEDADPLSGLRDFRKWIETSPFRDVVGHLDIPKIVAILDSSYALADLLRLDSKKQTTALLDCLKAGTLLAYAPPTLEREVRARLAESSHDRDRLSALWTKEYAPYVVTLNGNWGKGQIHELRDPTDADFVQAFDRISADTIIASDKDL